MSQHTSPAADENPYVGIVYDRLGDPIPSNAAERMACYTALLTGLRSRLSDGQVASSETRVNLALLADAVALVEEQVTAATAVPPAPPRTPPTAANEDRPATATPRPAGRLLRGHFITALTAAAVSIATYFAMDRWLPAASAPEPASITLIDALAQEVADRPKYDAYFALLTRLEKAINGFRAERGVYPATRDQAFLAVSSVDLFKAEAPDPVDATLWDFWESLTYASNGSDFKLISVGLGTCAAVRIVRPELLDPKRSEHPFDCLAFGIWTAGARDF